jgi:ribonuclease HI
MKTLKLDHNLADMVRNGKKTATWRIYDDKNISVNDEVELIDKIDPQNPDSWAIVGNARVDTVTEKRLGEINRADFDGHEEFSTRDEMLETYQKYYGSQVNFETPIKIIHFTLQAKIKNVVEDAMPRLKEAKLYTDGGSRGNPGPSASGYAVMSMDNQVVVKKGVYLGVTTNNQAEYQALKLGLEEVQGMGVGEVHVFMDSLLVVNQMLGKFKVKNRDLWPIHDAIVQLAATFKQITYTHVPRELNKVADSAVNEALDAAEQRQ